VEEIPQETQISKLVFLMIFEDCQSESLFFCLKDVKTLKLHCPDHSAMVAATGLYIFTFISVSNLFCLLKTLPISLLLVSEVCY
jgi:hypothetical protein